MSQEDVEVVVWGVGGGVGERAPPPDSLPPLCEHEAVRSANVAGERAAGLRCHVCLFGEQLNVAPQADQFDFEASGFNSSLISHSLPPPLPHPPPSPLDHSHLAVTCKFSASLFHFSPRRHSSQPSLSVPCLPRL